MVSGTTEQKKKELRLGMVGGGQGAFIGGVHRIAARLDDHYELVAGCFSPTPERSRASAGGAGCRARAGLCELCGDGESREGAGRRHRRGLDRDPQPRPLPGRRRFSRSRHPRHLRQADDDHARGCQEAGGPGEALGLRFRPYPQLYGLSDGAAGAPDGGGGALGKDPGGAGGVRPGLAHDQARGHRPETGRLAHGPQAVRAGGLHGRHRHATP